MAFDKSKRIDVVWAENRDEIFVKRLAEDVTKMVNAGLDKEEIKAALGNRKYVKFYSAWPQWMYPVDKIPKGSKWTDGVRYSVRATKRNGPITLTFLPVCDDLYIKYGAGKAIMPGLNVEDKVFLRVVDYRKLTANDFLGEVSLGSFFDDCLMKFWQASGLRLGFTVPVLREVAS